MKLPRDLDGEKLAKLSFLEGSVIGLSGRPEAI